MDDLALETRTGLPDPLRVLLEAYPRGGWEGDPGFDGLIRFWLERHLMFRQLLELLHGETEALLDARLDPAAYAPRLSRFGSLLLQELHTHHHVEDAHYFPRIRDCEARVASGFDILDRDHHALDGHLNAFAEAANGALRGLGQGKDAAAPLHTELGRLTRLLDRHLTDEEELVVPVLLRHGTAGFG